MEPGDLRESPAGSGDSDAGDWREVVPGRDDEVKAAETNGTTLELGQRDTCEEDDVDKQNKGGEQLHSPYEEELDPRIQVVEGTSSVCIFKGHSNFHQASFPY